MKQKVQSSLHRKGKKSHDKSNYITNTSRSGLLSTTSSQSHNHSQSMANLSRFASKVSLYPKKLQLVLNKASGKPQASLLKGVVTLNSQKDEDVFKTLQSMIQGCIFLIEMDSGQFVEQNVFLDFRLLSLHIESPQRKSCSEVISVAHLQKTEIPQQSLELIKLYQKSPAEIEKLNQLFSFNFLVLETVSHS